MFAAMIIFFASLVLIVGLFALKVWEERHGRRFAPHARARADDLAREIKQQLHHSRVQIEKLPPEIAHHTMTGIVSIAHSIAAFARIVEHNAHRIADFVSAKRGFERRETKNDFLKRVQEYKNEGVEASDDL